MIYLVAVPYAFFGAVVYGFLCEIDKDVYEPAVVSIVLFWPVVVLFLSAYKLGKFIARSFM